MKISICVINKNSGKTLENALRSVLEQVDERFEVVVIDESTDDSPFILSRLKTEFPDKLKFYLYGTCPLKSIGAARNMSIIKATGNYCIMHIDCDDVWYPFINDFADIFIEIEKNMKKDFLLAGHQINMAKRDFLLSIGPYQDVKSGEDRDLWMRLAKTYQYMPLDHVVFFNRLPLGNRINKTKALKRAYWSVEDEIRGGSKLSDIGAEFFNFQSNRPFLVKLLRVVYYPIAKILSRNLEKLDESLYFDNTQEWRAYKEKHEGTFLEIASIWGFPKSLDFLTSETARKIFEYKRSQKSIRDLLI